MVRITLRGVSKQFGSTVAVDNVDLVIGSGELFFLLGPSGCGKTTLMRIIAGLLEPSAGSIHFDDRDVTHLPTAQRNTALVFQGYALWPHMTVAQNVAFGLDVRGLSAAEKQQRVAEALRTVRLEHFGDRKPMQLSGGQQQRVALARAIVVHPDVLLLDEPLSNLDAKLRHEMRSEIRRIVDETKITTVYVTHDQEEALSIADRMALLRDGKVLQVGKPQDVYNRPATRFVADFLGRTNFVPATVRSADNGHVTLDTPAGPLRAQATGLAPGSTVTLAIRPESLRLSSASGSSGNTIEARHVHTLFLGHLAEHVFETAAGLRLSAEELKPPMRQWSTAPVQLTLDATDITVLTD
jgi:iron(III) transport system ATP-binding protein